MDSFKEFYLQRNQDESGVSGTGIVARGMVYPSGKVVMEWLTFHSSICIYQNISDVESIHGHCGKTLVVMGRPGQDQVHSATLSNEDEMAKKKLPKPRIPIPPPGKRHSTKKDYRRVKKIKEDQE